MLTYSIWLGGSILLCAVLAGLMLRCKHARRPWQTAGLLLLCGTLLGVVCSKLFFYLAKIDFMIADGWLESLFDTTITQWSFFGAAIGAVLGTVLVAKIMKCSGSFLLNTMAPAGALMVALARFGCFFLQDQMVGLGKYVESPMLCFFPISVINEWGEHYLAVFLLEGIVALTVALVSYFCFRKKEYCFLRTVFYLCLPQIFCESLHNASIRWLFVRVEQLTSILLVGVVLFIYILQLKQKRGARMPIAAWLTAVVLGVACEFALDKTVLPIPLIYGVMILGLVFVAIAEIVTVRRLHQAQETART